MMRALPSPPGLYMANPRGGHLIDVSSYGLRTLQEEVGPWAYERFLQDYCDFQMHESLKM